MTMENIMVLLEELSKINTKVIMFETHYLTIIASILEIIKQKLGNKKVVIELGLESSNKEVRENCLNKYIDNKEFVKRVNLIKSFGFGAEANIIFGAPFLTTQEQMRDTIQSIQWCFENSIEMVNLFSINIKPYTLLYKLYEEGQYSPVSHSDFIEVLKGCQKNILINYIYVGMAIEKLNTIKKIKYYLRVKKINKIMCCYHAIHKNELWYSMKPERLDYYMRTK